MSGRYLPMARRQASSALVAPMPPSATATADIRSDSWKETPSCTAATVKFSLRRKAPTSRPIAATTAITSLRLLRLLVTAPPTTIFAAAAGLTNAS